MAIAPEVDPSTQEDELWKELAQVPEASLRLEAMVEYCCAILARTGSVHAVIRGAADKEPFAARPVPSQTERIGRYLGSALRPDLSISEAGERYSALTSPELYWLLTVEFGWTAARHRKWLTSLLESELLGSSSTP